MISIHIPENTDKNLKDTFRSIVAQMNQEISLLRNETIKLRAENKQMNDRLNELEAT